jgi:acyl-CoA synthetase (AMP-forming)/AMP-acid ligase II
MSLRIYESDYPTPFLPQMSVFQYLLPDAPGLSPLRQFDPSLPAFIDGRDGKTVSRGQLKDTALRLGAGLHQLGVKRGSTACIWGYNSIEWVLAAYGSIAGGVTVSPANYA